MSGGEPGSDAAETWGGRYRAVRVLGEGAMGRVVQAEDLRLGRQVAVKVMGEALLGDRSSRERFLREARVAASLSHPNLAAMYDVGEEDGRIFLVMELAPGIRARELVAAAPDPRLLEVALGTARALAALHTRGVVHRDLKPENVHVAPDGGVKVLDFGLARPGDATGGEFRTQAEAVSGTPLYMAPELWRRVPASPASDNYAFGVMVHELVTGHPPWGGWRPADTPAADRPAWAAMPEGLAELVADCLAPEPAARPADGAALERRLAPLVARGFAGPLPAPGPRGAGGGGSDTFLGAGGGTEAPGGSDAFAALGTASGAGQAAADRSGAAATASRTDGAPGRTAGGTAPGPGTVPPPAVPSRRARWLLGLAALVLAAGVGVWSQRGGAPDPTPGRDLTELPNPAATEAGRGHWALAVAALRSGDRTRALEESAALVAAEPDLPEGWLRRAWTLYVIADRDASQDAFTEAYARIDRLGPRDRALLEALAPVLVQRPGDRTEAIRRLDALAARFPEDAELRFALAVQLSSRQELEAFRTASTEALRLDPGFAWVQYLRARRLENLGRADEAAEALAACTADPRPAPVCLRHRASLADLAGDCEAVGRDLDRELRASPRDGDALARRASLLSGTGAPEAQVRESLRLARAAGGLEGRPEPAVEAALATWSGALPAARSAAAAWDEAVADGADEDQRTAPRWWRLRLAEEAGDLELVRALSARTLAELGAWNPTRGLKTPPGRLAPALERLRQLTGDLDEAAFTRARDEREAGWRQGGELQRGSIWFYSRALPVRTAAEAADALAHLEDFKLELPSAAERSLAPDVLLAVGRTERLGGHPAAAVTLQAIADRCYVLDDPLAVIQARAELARLAEAEGEVEEACRRWAQVLERWPGGAEDGAVTGREAAARRGALGCG